MLSVTSPNSNKELSKLNFLLQASQKLTILIPYKSLHLTREVRTIKIGKDYIILQVPDQLFCPNIHDRVFIVTSNATQGVKAKVQEINYQKGIITLSDFSFLETPWYERKSERVEPKKPTTVAISMMNQRFRGRLENLSLHGLGVLLNTKNIQQVPNKIGEAVNVEIELGNAIPLLRVKANLIAVYPLGRYLTHLSLVMHPQNTQKTIILKYIISRKHDIMSEFEHVSIRAMEPICSMDLYF
jgi:hypothetical protein